VNNPFLFLAVAAHMVAQLSTTWAAPTNVGQDGLLPADLRCEYLVDPVGVDTASPRFSWKITPRPAERGVVQSAWQVKVMDSGGALLWDSGKVASRQSVNITYAGAPLQSNQDCRWQVRLWGRDDRAGPWSDPARFVMGLLDESDWAGPWIRYRLAQDVEHIWYRRNFDLEEVPERAVLHLASIGYHELYINGRRVDDRVLAPSVSNLQMKVFYVSYDVRAFLQPGRNVIGVWTGAAWAMADGSYGKGVWEQESAIRAQLDTSSGFSLHTDQNWKARVSHMRHRGKWKGGGLGEYGGEVMDARLNVRDWNQVDHDDSRWSHAAPYTTEGLSARRSDIRDFLIRTVTQKQLKAHMHEPDRKVREMKAVSVTYDPETDRSLYDMGVNFTGWLEFDLRQGVEGQRVLFKTANREEMIEEFDQVSAYIHDASGEGVFSHRFNYMAGRWMTVEGLGYAPEIDDLRGYLITNDRKRTGFFESSDPLFNQIYEGDLATYIANTVNGVTMDCPHRERYGYGEVALACSWGPGIPNYESAAFYVKGIQDWIDVQRKDGFVNTIAPQIYRGAGGTLWSSAPVTLGWEFHLAYGDLRQLETSYASMKKWVDFLHGHVSDEGVLVPYDSPSRFLGDWATPHGSEYGNTEPAKLFNNCVYAYCLDITAKSARALERNAEAEIYEQRLDTLRPNVHRKWYDEETGLYLDGRQLALAFPLFTGVTPEHLRESVLQRFITEIKENKPYLDTGSSGLPILLKFLVEHLKRPDLIHHCLQSTDRPSYGYFLKRGETTWPEYWQVDDIPSRIHTCYTGISGWFVRGVAGIQPDPEHPGMQNFRIEPKLVGDLEWAKARSASLYGTIVSEWSRHGNEATFVVEVPPNTSAIVAIPSLDPELVREGGKPTDEVEAVTALGTRDGEAIFKVGSGRYRFTSRVAR